MAAQGKEFDPILDSFLFSHTVTSDPSESFLGRQFLTMSSALLGSLKDPFRSSVWSKLFIIMQTYFPFLLSFVQVLDGVFHCCTMMFSDIIVLMANEMCIWDSYVLKVSQF